MISYFSLTISGISIGNISGPPLINWLIQTYSWRGALLIHAAIIAHVIPFGALLKVTKSHDESSGMVTEENDARDIPSAQPCDISVLDLSLTEVHTREKTTIRKKVNN